MLEKNLALRHGMNVTDTPTIILANGQRPTANGQRPTANGQRPTANGRRLLGAISADALERALMDGH